ncbi:MAG: hypothetical protein WCT22_02295 [Patescibacteria group bacterium]|jgi:hypothetical protein
MRLRNRVLFNFVVITALILSACGSANAVAPTGQPETRKPLTPDLAAQYSLYYQALVPLLCNPGIRKTISFNEIIPADAKQPGPQVTGDTVYGESGVEIGIVNPEGINELAAKDLLAHEIAHACGVAAEQGEIEPTQEIMSYDNVTLSRIIDDQTQKGPYIDLTVTSTNVLGQEQTGIIPFEEIFSYFFGNAIIEDKFGYESNEAIFSHYLNLHPASSSVLKELFKESGITFDELSGFKRKADALSIIKALELGLIKIGNEKGIDTSQVQFDPRSKYQVVNLVASAFQYDVPKEGQSKQEIYSNIVDSVAQFFYQKNSNNLTQEEFKIIGEIIERLILGHEIQPTSFELDNIQVVNGRILFAAQSLIEEIPLELEI